MPPVHGAGGRQPYTVTMRGLPPWLRCICIVKITSLDFPLGKEGEVIFVLLIIQGKDLAVQTVQQIKHSGPGVKGTHFEPAFGAGDPEGDSGKVLVGPCLFGGSNQNKGNPAAHKLVHNVVNLTAVAVVGDQKGHLTESVAGPETPGFLEAVEGFQGRLSADTDHLVVEILCQDQGFSPPVDVDHIRPGDHPGSPSQKIVVQPCKGGLESLGGQIVKCLRNGPAICIRGDGHIHMDVLMTEKKLIEGRGQPDLKVREASGTQLLAQPDDGSLGDKTFFTELFQGEIDHDPGVAFNKIDNLFL